MWHGLVLMDSETCPQELMIADVSYICEDGPFVRLFNTSLPNNDPVNGSGVPENYVPIHVGEFKKNLTSRAQSTCRRHRCLQNC